MAVPAILTALSQKDAFLVSIIPLDEDDEDVGFDAFRAIISSRFNYEKWLA